MNLIDILKKLKLKKNSAISPSANRDIKIKDKRNRPIFILRLLSLFIIFLLVLSVMGTVFFVYSSITNSIGQIQSIALYQSEAHVELIDFGKLDKVEKRWQEKTNSLLPDIKRNPFVIQIPTEPTNNLSASTEVILDLREN